jgi:hypothetical protein
MTKKDFIAIADALNSARSDTDPRVNRGVNFAAQNIASVCAEGNPQFKRDRFLAAAGVPRYGLSGAPR